MADAIVHRGGPLNPIKGNLVISGHSSTILIPNSLSPRVSLVCSHRVRFLGSLSSLQGPMAPTKKTVLFPFISFSPFWSLVLISISRFAFCSYGMMIDLWCENDTKIAEEDDGEHQQQARSGDEERQVHSRIQDRPQIPQELERWLLFPISF